MVSLYRIFLGKNRWEMVRLDRIFLGKNKHEEWWAYTEYFLGKIHMRNGELIQNISW